MWEIQVFDRKRGLWVSGASRIWGLKIKCFKLLYYEWIRNKIKVKVLARVTAILSRSLSPKAPFLIYNLSFPQPQSIPALGEQPQYPTPPKDRPSEQGKVFCTQCDPQKA